ncbi:MAG: hypothetical protein WCF33_23925 [Pseudonocardiaceae bacterium]
MTLIRTGAADGAAFTVDPATIVRIIEEISYADGSAGWTHLIGTSIAFFAWLEPHVARELIAGRPYGASTCVVAPTGSAAPDGAGGFTLCGRWAFNTGVRHARFSQVAAVVLDEHGAPRTGAGNIPEWRLAFFPTDRSQVLDTWDSAGRAVRRPDQPATTPRRPAVAVPGVCLPQRDPDGLPARGCPPGARRFRRAGPHQDTRADRATAAC